MDEIFPQLFGHLERMRKDRIGKRVYVGEVKTAEGLGYLRESEVSPMIPHLGY